MKNIITASLALLSMLLCSQLIAAEGEQEQRANALLERAAEFLKAEGERSFAVFSRQGDFTESDLYVFVIDRSGVMVASGGPSRVLIGRNIASLLDDHLQETFQQVLAVEEADGVQVSEYRWLNWQQGKEERKKAFYRVVNDYIVAVGYYLPRTGKQGALVMLDRVVEALTTNQQATIARINDLDSAFYQDDLYPFVVDGDTRRFVAHGYNPGLIGTRFDTLRDHAGNPLGDPVLALMTGKDEAEFSYQWRNPVTQHVESKTIAIRRLGNLLACVGWYTE
ncbi:hypothetical protein MFKK_29180 [Halopseudomonas aestusnigri]|uniref:cache domain-containing protein n=1 Tax=Halopseudomonas TaxID=2901189 RepID=UPI0022B71A78|nr:MULTISPECIES: cache domain-containing protein [Halopseudomonas]BDX20108.1 hypothetical protein MFKK_29180 [Halopseudomonas aestusnigri]